jgi:hypothetical protein
MRWEELRGDERKRFCDKCQTHVHNLSEMGNRELGEFVETASRGGHYCVSYVERPDGTMVKASSITRFVGRLRSVRFPVIGFLASGIAFVLGACARNSKESVPTVMGEFYSDEASYSTRVGKAANVRMLGTPLPPAPDSQKRRE